MKASYSTLAKFKNAEFRLANLGSPKDVEGTLCERRHAVTLNSMFGDLVLAAADRIGREDAGLWVPYAPGAAVFGYAAGGETWGASGPFSGCTIAVGKQAGRIYMAHVAVHSGSTASELWSQRGWSNESVWGEWKVDIASDKFYSARYIFVDWSRGEHRVEVTQVDVNTGMSMGGTDGKIFKVKKMGLRH